MTQDKKLTCSFCGKNRDEVDKLIAGPGVYICNECIELSYNIIIEPTKKEVDDSPPIPKPADISGYLDQYIIGHKPVKEMLAVSAYNHYKRLRLMDTTTVNIEKSNILLLGSTGTGKTLFAKTLARKLDVPFAIADATTLTESGYMGDDVVSVIERLLHESDYDVEKAQRGIIYIDEIDKKAKKGQGNGVARDVSGEGVQQALLRLIEGTTVRVPVSGNRRVDHDHHVDFDTTHVLFILGGAFVGIESQIEHRKKKSSSIGFSANVLTAEERKHLMSDVTSDDIVQYGIIPELVGRVPVLGVLDHLTVSQLYAILRQAKDNVVSQSIELLRMDDITLEFGTDYLHEAAELAYEKKMGARALKNIVERTLMHVMYHAPDLQESGVVGIKFTKYPSTPETKPLLVYGDGTEKPYEEYTIYRGHIQK